MSLVRRSATLTLALALLWPAPASPWGATGHRIVALVAERLLTPEARAQVTDLLGPTTTLAEVADWADEIRATRPQTGPWHYVNIPRTAGGYVAPRDCPRGCVVSALHHFVGVLGDPRQDKGARQEALRWVIHLVADAHQPLHAIDDHDRGGNDVSVSFFGLPSNLHRVWDSEIIDWTYADPGVLLDQVVARVTATNRQTWEAGGPEQWVEESHLVAVNTAYALPSTRGLDDAYVAKSLPVIHEQLARAAVRLAWLLNRTVRVP